MNTVDEQENEKNRDLVWLLKEDRTANTRDRNNTADNQNWKVLEKNKMTEPNAKLNEKKKTDLRLKRSTSFPVKTDNSKSNVELRYPVNEADEEGLSPVLYRSKSSLWTVSTDSSAVTAHQRFDNRTSELAPSENKSVMGSRSNLAPTSQEPGSSDQLPGETADLRNSPRFQVNSPQPPKPERGVPKTLSEDKGIFQPRTTKSLLMSVHDFKTKNNRDPELINEHLKVSCAQCELLFSGL